jgi:hypothetical protein
VFRWPDLEAAVSHAFSHPLLPAARRDAALLAGTRLADAFWTLREWSLLFDNGMELRIWPEQPEVRWRLGVPSDRPQSEDVDRVGCPPIPFLWMHWQEVREMDCSELVAKRLGAYFRDLFMNDGGVFVYFRNHLVLCFQAVCSEADGRSILYVHEEE